MSKYDFYYDDKKTNEQIIAMALTKILENQMAFKTVLRMEKNDFYDEKEVIRWLDGMV